MMNGIRTEYVNPQTMKRQNSRINSVNADGKEETEKKQRALEEERKSVQNSLLLMKTTSGDSVGSQESIELLEKKLEEIESRIRAGEKEKAETLPEEGTTVQGDKGFTQGNRFDVYLKER